MMLLQIFNRLMKNNIVITLINFYYKILPHKLINSTEKVNH